MVQACCYGCVGPFDCYKYCRGLNVQHRVCGRGCRFEVLWPIIGRGFTGLHIGKILSDIAPY